MILTEPTNEITCSALTSNGCPKFREWLDNEYKNLSTEIAIKEKAIHILTECQFAGHCVLAQEVVSEGQNAS